MNNVEACQVCNGIMDSGRQVGRRWVRVMDKSKCAGGLEKHQSENRGEERKE